PGRAWGLTPVPAGPRRCPGGRRNGGGWAPGPGAPPWRRRGLSGWTRRSGGASRGGGGVWRPAASGPAPGGRRGAPPGGRGAGGGGAGPGATARRGGGAPARGAAVVRSMIDGPRAPDPAGRGGRACLTAVFAVAGGAPADPGVAMLDDVAGLLRPGALAARMERVPPYHPRRLSLAGQVVLTAELLAAEGATGTFIAEQLSSLRASPL